MTQLLRSIFGITIALGLIASALFVFPDLINAKNISNYRNIVSDSGPGRLSNHTMSFRLLPALDPQASFELTPQTGFEIVATSTFDAERNVELYVNGARRSSGTSLSASEDQVEIVPGTPGMIRYTLNTTTGIPAGAQLELRIGNNTSDKQNFSETYSTSTGTTTIYADTPGIINDATAGTKKMFLEVFNNSAVVAETAFVFALVDRVGVGPADTTEDIPPVRFNGAPTTTVPGTTPNVEIFLQTDEFATCRFSRTPNTEYFSMTNTFTNTGLIFHTHIVPVQPKTTETFYIRCTDDEGNFNLDDYVISFDVIEVPEGEPNPDAGDGAGGGSGTGDGGTGDGSGSGNTGGSGEGEESESSSSGGGGSGGGGGGGSGGGSGGAGGGGPESEDNPFPSGDAQVIISGTGAPNATINILVDGKQAASTRAGAAGNFSFTIEKIARGVYTFGVFAVDAQSGRSGTFSTAFTVVGARTSSLSNISLSPTIRVTPDPATAGSPITASGFTIPGATVTVENERDKATGSRKTYTATAAANGAWSVSIDSAGFTNGTYKARARAQLDIVTTTFSNYVLYGVGQSADRPLNADLSRDGKVNLTDFSILLFWWGTNGGDSSPSADINSDTRVNLTDFSILLFNWTG